jgi:triphosphoribosyl-dephospho-CoA synthase
MVGWLVQTAGTIPQLVMQMQPLLQNSLGAYSPGRLPRRWQASELAGRAVGALVEEALLTPKPALVDGRGSGAHRDLDLERLLRSAHSLRDTFLEMAAVSEGQQPNQELREELAQIGRAGERDMFAATDGSNAHRGAIWIIGLLVAARAISGPDADAGEVAVVGGTLAGFRDRYAPNEDSHGSRVCRRYGVGGARGEARAGFPHVVHAGLPALWRARAQGVDETCARLDALMTIMVTLDDTCLLHRGGLPALQAAQRGARAVMLAGGSSSVAGRGALLCLDTELLAHNASPGGCADLLAACIFLDG